jgi:phosphoglucosamine mutase
METGKKLSELKKIMTKLPQVLINVIVGNMSGWEDVAAIQEAIAKAETDLGDRGRILVRPSGTEPLIRVMVESDTSDNADSIATGVADVIKNELG